MLDFDYQTVLVNISADDEDREGYRAVNPFGRVPALIHNGRVILESAAQAMYLADLRPDADFAPPIGDPRRATYYELFVLGPSELEPRVTAAWRAPNDPDSNRELERALSVYESRIIGPHLLGEALLAVDIFVHWGLRFFDPELVKQYPKLALYFERMNRLVSWEGY